MVSVIIKLIPTYVAGTKAAMDASSTVLILSLVAALTIYISIRMVQGAAKEVSAKKRKA